MKKLHEVETKVKVLLILKKMELFSTVMEAGWSVEKRIQEELLRYSVDVF